MSKKLRLNLDRLHVESFHTQPAGAAARGTVRGNELDETSTFDLGKHTFLCTAGCPGGTLVCEPESGVETS